MRKIKDAKQRFLKNITNITPSMCMEWGGTKYPCGYGIFFYNGKLRAAHRVSMMLWREADPGNLCVLHKCDNKACVNPEHLFFGTKRDNTIDMVKKGLHPGQKKTHCVHGHEYTLENTKLTDGRRSCRACHRTDSRRRYHRNKKINIQP